MSSSSSPTVIAARLPSDSRWRPILVDHPEMRPASRASRAIRPVLMPISAPPLRSPSRAQQGQGQPDPLFRLPSLFSFRSAGEDSGDKILLSSCRCCGYADYRQLEAAAVIGGRLLQRSRTSGTPISKKLGASPAGGPWEHK